MTFSDLQSYVLDRLSITSADTNRVTQVKNILNQVYLQLCAEENLNTAFATLTVTAGGSSVALPAGTTGILSLRNGIDIMEPITLEQMASYVASTSAGTSPLTIVSPLYYSLTSPLVLQVWPSPSVDTALSALLNFAPATMSANSDTPSLIASAWHDMLAELTIQRIAISEEELWPQQLGVNVAEDLLQRFRAWNMMQEGPSSTAIPLKGYTR
jgi:hypothetical protein